MIEKYIKVTISETEDGSIFNQDVEKFKTIDEVRDFIVNKYGVMPDTSQKVMVGDNEVVGFTHTFKSRDWSHFSSESWEQTDVIEITDVVETTRLL